MRENPYPRPSPSEPPREPLLGLVAVFGASFLVLGVLLCLPGLREPGSFALSRLEADEFGYSTLLGLLSLMLGGTAFLFRALARARLREKMPRE